jgi:hypothetical protein
MLLSNDRISCKIREVATFLEALEFWLILKLKNGHLLEKKKFVANNKFSFLSSSLRYPVALWQ